MEGRAERRAIRAVKVRESMLKVWCLLFAYCVGAESVFGDLWSNQAVLRRTSRIITQETKRVKEKK